MRLIASPPLSEYIPLKVLNRISKEEKSPPSSTVNYGLSITSSSSEWIELAVLSRALKEEKASFNAATNPAAAYILLARASSATSISFLAHRDSGVEFIKASFGSAGEYMKKALSR